MSQLLNHITVTEQFAVPKVGDGATLVHYTDRTPATVIRVYPSGKTAVIQEDRYTRVDGNGMSDAQCYTYAPDPNGTTHNIRLTKHGWRVLRTRQKVLIGIRERYYDFSF